VVSFGLKKEQKLLLEHLLNKKGWFYDTDQLVF
jgi:hypothetical protein